MRFEFGDLYRFFVSLGVVLIALAIVTPWLFLREPLDLFLTEQEVSQLTPLARETVSERQGLARTIIQVLPIFSAIGVILGVLSVSFGLFRWYKNQRIFDEEARVNLELSKKSLRDATLDEIDTHREMEAEEVAELAQTEGDEIRKPITLVVSEALGIEKMVLSRLQEVFGNKYEVSPQKVVGGAFVDVVLRGKGLLTRDYIFEVKYIRRGFNYGWLKEVALKLRYASTVYAHAEGRLPNTVLLIVAPPEVWADPKYGSFVERLASDLPRRRSKNRVIYLTPAEIDSLGSDEFQKKLGVYA